MSDATEAMTAADTSATARRLAWPRLFWWSLRRELWEHRSVWIAPLVLAGFCVLLHFVAALTISDAERAAALAAPIAGNPFQILYGTLNLVILVGTMIVGMLYSLDALQSERRDRSILFWKSMPVSDRVSVGAKAAIAIVYLLLQAFVLIVAANIVMAGLQTLAWTMRGYDPAELWARLDLPLLWVALAAPLPFMMLWNAPLYAWLLAVSAWARKVSFLWAAAPVVGFFIVEHAALHKSAAHWMIEKRLAGSILEPYARFGHHDNQVTWVSTLADIDPARLYALPGLWIGAAIAALFIFVAIRLRRSRAPN